MMKILPNQLIEMKYRVLSTQFSFNSHKLTVENCKTLLDLNHFVYRISDSRNLNQNKHSNSLEIPDASNNNISMEEDEVIFEFDKAF